MSMNLETHGGEIVAAATKGTPPLAVTGMAIAGVPLQDWVLAATLVYTLLQIALLVHKFVKGRAAERAGKGGA